MKPVPASFPLPVLPAQPYTQTSSTVSEKLFCALARTTRTFRKFTAKRLAGPCRKLASHTKSPEAVQKKEVISLRRQREWTGRKRSFHSPCAGCCSSLLRHISAWHPFQIPDTAAGTRARRDSLPGLALTSGSSSRPPAIFSMGSPCLLFFLFFLFFSSSFFPSRLLPFAFCSPPAQIYIDDVYKVADGDE